MNMVKNRPPRYVPLKPLTFTERWGMVTVLGLGCAGLIFLIFLQIESDRAKENAVLGEYNEFMQECRASEMGRFECTAMWHSSVAK